MTDVPPLSCLVATDLSPRSDRALVRAFRIAARGGGNVVVLHVVEEDYPQKVAATLRDEVESELHTQITAMPESKGVHWTIKVERGHDYERIASVARRQSIDLLVLGGRRESKLADLFLASTAQRVVRQSAVPVLVAKSPYRGPYGTALAAVDPSEHSREGIGFALRAFPELLVTAFHAVEGGWALSQSPDAPPPHERLSAEESARIEAPLRQVPGFTERCTFSAYRGGARDVLNGLVLSHRPDLVICGQSKSARSFFLGEDLPGFAMQSIDRDLLIMP
jgi:nucleotide-binding universal stress UspA family protein